MSNHLTPADVVKRIIGRPEVVGAAIGIHPKSPYQWAWGTSTRDAGDIPSPRHMRSLLAYAAARGLPLTSDHLIWGASAEEIDQLLAAMPPARPAQAAE